MAQAGSQSGQGMTPGHGSPGASMAGSPGASEGQGQSPGQPGGSQAGNSHDEHTLDHATNIGANHTDTQVAASGTSRGPTRSEVILGAAEHGFANRGYERVYADYERHAEEALEHDEIPGGYRFYVRRYFQLIRPRDEH